MGWSAVIRFALAVSFIINYLLVFHNQLLLCSCTDIIYKYCLINKLLILAVHCEWNDWVNGTCSKTCGAGVQNNTRTKHVEEFNGGTCTGKFWEVLECEVQPCPSNAVHLILYKIIIVQLLTKSYVLYIFEIIFCHSSLWMEWVGKWRMLKVMWRGNEKKI